MADWNSLIDDPLFNAGLGLLGGASTGNPWGAAADQLNRYQALRQNRELQKMHGKLYEAQARKAEEEGQARQARQQTLAQVRATITDPRELQLFDIDPEAYAKSKVETRLKPMVVGRSLIDPSNPDKPLYRDPEPTPKPGEIERLVALVNDPNTPPAHKQVYAQALQKMTTHAPAPTAISYGSPMPMLNKATGEVEYVQPSNRAGAPAQPIPGYTQPPKQEAPDVLTEQQRNTISSLDQDSSAIQGAMAAVQTHRKAFGPQVGGVGYVFGEAGDAAINARLTPEQVQARSLVFNNVSSIIKQRAGTAQSVQEQKKIMSFLPSQLDKDSVVLSKLDAYNKYLAQQRSAVHVIPKIPQSAPPASAAPSSTLSPAEQQELEALRKKYRK